MKRGFQRTGRWAWTPRRIAIAGGGAAAALAAAGVTWALLPGDPQEPRPREYRDATACLLTDQQGVAGKDAAPIWAAMQSASARTHGQVRYLAVTGEQSVANAESFVGTLVLGRCSVIVAEPGIPDQAVRAAAAQHSGQRFLVIGGVKAGSNVTVVAAAKIDEVVGGVLNR
ncbi:MULTISPECIES: hypothetical protein [unclassified Actinoplanes]|uniref:hypothetical protein n=1 Tax=unclassified Actinoplanes TaxID=2626549 RepID=UPI0002F1A339|nr:MULTISPECIES: hypothetical protein [unclassified Actinoplanes]